MRDNDMRSDEANYTSNQGLPEALSEHGGGGSFIGEVDLSSESVCSAFLIVCATSSAYNSRRVSREGRSDSLGSHSNFFSSKEIVIYKGDFCIKESLVEEPNMGTEDRSEQFALAAN